MGKGLNETHAGEKEEGNGWTQEESHLGGGSVPALSYHHSQHTPGKLSSAPHMPPSWEDLSPSSYVTHNNAQQQL